MKTKQGAPIFDRVVLDGVGLLGGSVGLAVRQAKVAGEIVGWDRSPKRSEMAVRLGILDRSVPHFDAALVGLEEAEAGEQKAGDAETGRDDFSRPILVLAAVPVRGIAGELAKAIRAVRRHNITNRLVILTDTGSVKGGIAEAVLSEITPESWPKNVVYMGSHPIAGREKSGPEAATADLFAGKRTILTKAVPPNAPLLGEATRRLAEFWVALGSDVLEMTAEDHDRVLAETSHLPHLISATLSGTVSPDLFGCAGTGLADMTRLAAGNPEVWTDILRMNRVRIREAVERFEEKLAQWKAALGAEDDFATERLLTEAKGRRDALGN